MRASLPMLPAARRGDWRVTGVDKESEAIYVVAERGQTTMFQRFAQVAASQTSVGVCPEFRRSGASPLVPAQDLAALTILGEMEK